MSISVPTPAAASTPAAARSAAAPAVRPARVAPHVSFALHDLRRTLRMVESTFFVVALPTLLYLMFGAMTEWADQKVGNGNVAAYTMVSMAAYGAATATTAIAGTAAIERMSGWTRQLALTSLSQAGYLGGKVVVALVLALLAVTCVFVAGVLTGARFDSAGTWAAALALTVVAATPFALYGLAAATVFRSEAAVSAASGLLVILGFLGNVFVPLSGTLLEFARFTPMYGTVALARWPQLEGAVIDTGGVASSDPLWFVLANVLGWTAIFAMICLVARRRRTGRV